MTPSGHFCFTKSGLNRSAPRQVDRLRQHVSVRAFNDELDAKWMSAALGGLTSDDLFFVHPERLYQNLCALDPHSEAFSQWLAWAKAQRRSRPEHVAEAWHKILPRDLEPILFLMNSYAARGAFSTALQAIVARLCVLASDMQFPLRVPFTWMADAAKQFRNVRQTLYRNATALIFPIVHMHLETEPEASAPWIGNSRLHDA